jgi:hypothetical protein
MSIAVLGQLLWFAILIYLTIFSCAKAIVHQVTAMLCM